MNPEERRKYPWVKIHYPLTCCCLDSDGGVIEERMASKHIYLLTDWIQLHKMKRKLNLPYQNGFTFIEIVIVLVILGLLGFFAVQKFAGLDEAEQKNALFAGISELNNRERLAWATIRMNVGWTDDELLFSHINTDLGPEYRWNPAAKINGGTLHFRTGKAELERILSSNSSPGKWYIK